MRLLDFGLLYLLVGLGCAAWILREKRSAQGLLDAALALLFWPLFAPFLFGKPAPRATHDDQALLSTLEEMSQGAMGPLVPQGAEVRALSTRLKLVGERIAEIDKLLAQPAFSEADAKARQKAFEDQGDVRGAQAAAGRAQNIQRLRALRDRLARELEQIRELLGQLRVQAELVRLSGATTSQTQALVGEILARIEGLDAVLAEEAA